MRYFLLLFLPLFFFEINAQPARELDAYFREVRKNKNATFPKSLTDPIHTETVFNSTKRFLNDTSSVIRMKSIQLLAITGKKSKNLATRKKAVHLLVNQWNTSDHSLLVSVLKKFQKEDFEPFAIDSLLRFLDRPSNQKNALLRLIGFVASSTAIENLRKFSSKENPPSLRWSALLAMTRLGDVETATTVLEKAKKLKVNDETVSQLFPDLVYTRDKLLIDYMIEVLKSDQPLCESADNDNPTLIVCGYRVMEQLAPAIKNYPLMLDNSGDIKTNDYKQALQTVRQWFEKNRDYTIEKNTY